MLLEKSENDDRYIEALKAELSKLRNQPAQVQTKVVYKDRPDNTNETGDNKVDPLSASTGFNPY